MRIFLSIGPMTLLIIGAAYAYWRGMQTTDIAANDDDVPADIRTKATRD